ncbi:helix-turn-helix domain-containing protein [Fodinibius sp.]|uniref:helix-turn-helix domain-containing protein n=1 Tax=Fodinibius sp. TaxID=1872440 RepID=UPI002ACE4743|nr:helix-turn-helix domain-containing protein [Fodinibius sp.]MDZ7658016.1 helix-turn-helix domain-containing protein [Fodinibius sp.]
MSTDLNSHKDFQEKPLGSTLVDKLTYEIESNLNNDQFGVNSLAQAVGMSRSSLHRKLKRHLGVSTSQFIREYRLKRAMEILRNEGITASESAYRVGFSSPTYFNTCFHKFYGITPGEVKSKSSNEIENLIHGQGTTIAKSNTKKRLLWALILLPVFVLAIFYLFGPEAKENQESKKNEINIDGKSIAVLPLKNWTGNTDLEYISDGMTDAVISRLTKIECYR